jgi:hypothetical protein
MSERSYIKRKVIGGLYRSEHAWRGEDLSQVEYRVEAGWRPGGLEVQSMVLTNWSVTTFLILDFLCAQNPHRSCICRIINT